MAEPTPTAPTPASASIETTTSKGSTSETTKKAGYRTTEFWLSLAALLLTALYTTDAIPTSGPAVKIAAVAAAVLGTLGYTVMRTKAKS